MDIFFKFKGPLLFALLFGHSTSKVPLNAEFTFLLFKEQKPFKLKKISIGRMESHKLSIETSFDPC
jgi:hypothetical protein